MLLAMDVGNSNIVLGLYRALEPAATPPKYSPALAAEWRITTPRASTTDEFGVTLRSLFDLNNVAITEVTGIAISSVVPPLDSILREVCERYFKLKPLFVEPGVKTGLPILTDNPAEVGADRIVNCVAAFDLLGGRLHRGRHGHRHHLRRRLPPRRVPWRCHRPGPRHLRRRPLQTAPRACTRVEVKQALQGHRHQHRRTTSRSASTTATSGLVDGILARMLAHLSAEAGAAPGDFSAIQTIATGGLAKLIAEGSKYIGQVDDSLTLTGLRLLYERNSERAAKAKGERVRRHAAPAL